MEITGTNIKRTQVEGPQPIAIITREEIRRRGVTTTNELVRSLAYMSSFNDELTSSSPNVSGSASVGFRGLDGDQTVVLLNGRRLANYGFDGRFTNLNTIPLGAIERVEILKDGASAIYGADAIGGVVHFITRRDYQGRDATVGYGKSSRNDADETTASANAGFGDFDEDRLNVLVNVNYFRREPLWNLDRERTRSADFRPLGGNNQLSTFAPTGNFSNGGVQQPFLPCPSADLLVSPSPLTPGDVNSSSCVFDFAPFRVTMFGTERTGGFVSGNFKLTDEHRAFAEVMLSQTSTFLSAAPAPGNFTMAADNPNNPHGVAATVRGRPLQAGPRVTDQDSTASRVVVGLRGELPKAPLPGVEYEVGLGQSRNKVVNNDGGYLRADAMFAAIADGSFNPFVTTNDPAVVAAIAANDAREGRTVSTFVDAKLSGVLAELEHGPLGIAVGGVYAKDEIADIPGPNQRAPGPIAGQSNVFGSITQSAVEAERKMAAAYLEVAGPVLKDVEFQFAVRHDYYAGGTESTTPKLALSYKPNPYLAWRASYAEGFKMPSLRDWYGGTNQSADSVQDFNGCAARNVAAASCPRLQFDRFSGGNPDLDPERSTSVNLGVIVEPSTQFNIGVDYFIIDKKDEIGLVPTQFVLDSVPFVAGTTTTLDGDSSLAVRRDSAGTVTGIFTTVKNLGQRKIRGADVTSTLRLPLGAGPRLTLSGSATIFERYAQADMPGAPLYSRLGLLNLPRWKSVISVAADWAAWSATLTHNNMARMFDKPQATAAVPVAPNERVINHFETFDLGLVYRGYKGVRIHGGVKNLLDNEPAFANNDARTLGFAQVHDIRGRFYHVAVNYQF